jgi:hypothetical protein
MLHRVMRRLLGSSLRGITVFEMALSPNGRDRAPIICLVRTRQTIPSIRGRRWQLIKIAQLPDTRFLFLVSAWVLGFAVTLRMIRLLTRPAYY